MRWETDGAQLAPAAKRSNEAISVGSFGANTVAAVPNGRGRGGRTVREMRNSRLPEHATSSRESEFRQPFRVRRELILVHASEEAIERASTGIGQASLRRQKRPAV